MSSRALAFAAIAAICMSVLPARAAVSLNEVAGHYVINQKGSSIHFSIANAGGGSLKGDFSRFSGTIRLDNNDVGRSAVTITIFPESVATGESRVDDFLRSDAVFNVVHTIGTLMQ